MPHQQNRAAAAPAAYVGAIRTLRKQSPRIILLTPVAVLLLLVLVACVNKSNSGNGSDSARSSQSAAPEDTGTPAVEGTGPEQPPPAQPNPPKLDIASLPVGGGSDNTSAQHQCAGVGWLSAELGGVHIPDGLSIVVTNVRVEPASTFTKSTSDSRCADPACRSSFVFRHETDTCVVAVDAKRPGDATLSIDGKVRCPAGQQQTCADFIAEAHRNEGSITLHWEPDTSESSAPAVNPSPSTD
jgi:hypothetical protein